MQIDEAKFDPQEVNLSSPLHTLSSLKDYYGNIGRKNLHRTTSFD